MNPLNALQNMADYCDAKITVKERLEQDKRRTVQRYYAQIGLKTISPMLDYTGLNCFLMGYAAATGK